MTTPIAIPFVVTPQQSMAFAIRDFPLPEVALVDNGFLAFTVKPDRDGFQSAEFFARSPEIAVEQLARLLVQAPSKRN